ncbi:MAG: hypothetical protein HYT12_00785 [Candidatus Liptonbacteria bacterium]|nr:hypothetical protein [Candidatus Liptonbacteria bacterium]
MAKLELRGNQVVVKEIPDVNFKVILDSVFKDGVPRFFDFENKDGREMAVSVIKPNEKDFDLALLGWLRRNGYQVEIVDPKLDKTVESLIKNLPDSPFKSGAVRELPNMTYLEKTFLLEEIKKTDKGNTK